MELDREGNPSASLPIKKMQQEADEQKKRIAVLERSAAKKAKKRERKARLKGRAQRSNKMSFYDRLGPNDPMNSTKLRKCGNSSFKVNKTPSLNDCMIQGPANLQSLEGMILWWRCAQEVAQHMQTLNSAITRLPATKKT